MLNPNLAPSWGHRSLGLKIEGTGRSVPATSKSGMRANEAAWACAYSGNSQPDQAIADAWSRQQQSEIPI